MKATQTYTKEQPADLHCAVRNRYYFGKLLDVVHFDIEQEYFNYKRWLINRRVLGYGVVCGLNVVLQGDTAVAVTSGFAIDRWGREIIVPGQTNDFNLPTLMAPKPEQPPAECHDEDLWYHLVICYYECGGSPEPALGDECGTEICVPSLTQERYKLDWRKGKAPEPPHDECLTDLIMGDRINRRGIAMHISQRCPRPPCDPCIELANVKLARNPDVGGPDVDISVRPIVYTNDLLYELFASMSSGRNNNGRTGK